MHRPETVNLISEAVKQGAPQHFKKSLRHFEQVLAQSEKRIRQDAEAECAKPLAQRTFAEPAEVI